VLLLVLSLCPAGIVRQNRAERLFTDAMQNYSNGNYWDALFQFGEFSKIYPDQSQKDSSDLYIVRSLSAMEMRKAYEQVNMILENEDYSLKSELYLENLVLNFRDGNLWGVREAFDSLWHNDPPAHIAEHALYYLGISYDREEMYDSAIVTLKQIPENSGFYSYALHSIAGSFALLGFMDSSRIYHTVVHSLSPADSYEEEIISASRYLLGVHLYEDPSIERNFSKAQYVLSQIPQNSGYYEKSFLVRAWIAVKYRNWEELYNLSTELAETADDVRIVAEAEFLRAFATLVKSENFSREVITEIEGYLANSQKIIDGYVEPSKSDIAAKEDQYWTNIEQYWVVSTRVVEILSLDKEERVQSEMGSLKRECEIYSYKIKKGLYPPEPWRNIQSLQSEIHYLLGPNHCEYPSPPPEPEPDPEIEAEMLKLMRQLELVEQ